MSDFHNKLTFLSRFKYNSPKTNLTDQRIKHLLNNVRHYLPVAIQLFEIEINKNRIKNRSSNALETAKKELEEMQAIVGMPSSVVSANIPTNEELAKLLNPSRINKLLKGMDSMVGVASPMAQKLSTICAFISFTCTALVFITGMLTPLIPMALGFLLGSFFFSRLGDSVSLARTLEEPLYKILKQSSKLTLHGKQHMPQPPAENIFKVIVKSLLSVFAMIGSYLGLLPTYDNEPVIRHHARDCQHPTHSHHHPQHDSIPIVVLEPNNIPENDYPPNVFPDDMYAPPVQMMQNVENTIHKYPHTANPSLNSFEGDIKNVAPNTGPATREQYGFFRSGNPGDNGQTASSYIHQHPENQNLERQWVHQRPQPGC